MSNRKSGEMPDRRKPQVSLAMEISQGLGGSKENPKGVSDVKGVNIRPLLSVMPRDDGVQYPSLIIGF